MNLLKEQYLKTRTRTVEICRPLALEDYIPQPVDFVSPPKWHLAHTTWFFEEMILKKFDPNFKVFHPDFSFLFNSYYNTIGTRVFRADRGNITRPGVTEIYDYRTFVDERIVQLLEKINTPELEQLVALGINHEQQHQELLVTDFKYILGHNPIFPVYKEHGALVNDKNMKMGWHTIQEGVYEVGYNGDAFHFDNERNAHKTYVQGCDISLALVSNGEFMKFIEDGGYQQFKIWLDDGWRWLKDNNISCPMYWHKIDGSWFHYTLEGLIPIDKEAILSHCSFYEANAFAAWKGMRLPTEFEWEVAADHLEWGTRWEWTNSAYLPYPGFNIAPGAVGEYNGKFMINQMVLRGGSVATAEGHTRKTYRNFFQPHYQWQFSGIRLVKDKHK